MSEYFGQKCIEHGLTNSVRDTFYNHNMNLQKDKLTFGEEQMKKRGAKSFKDELREAIKIEIVDPNNRTFYDVIHALNEHYHVECRVAGNTISYKHPQYLDKNGKPVSVRGSRLGEIYTRKVIEYELTKNTTENTSQGELSSLWQNAMSFRTNDRQPAEDKYRTTLLPATVSKLCEVLTNFMNDAQNELKKMNKKHLRLPNVQE